MEHVTKPMTRTLDLGPHVREVIAVELPVQWLSTQHPNASLFECSHFVRIVREFCEGYMDRAHVLLSTGSLKSIQ